MQRYFIETWGCQMNQHDTERLAGHLERIGLTSCDSADEADLVLLNTCSVRDKPVQKLRSRIGELAAARRDRTIGVCGCVAQQEGQRLLEASPSVGFVLGPGQIERVGEAVERIRRGSRAVLTGFDPETDYNFHTIFRKSSTKGMVTVIEGCNEYCTFCVVPYTRGREANRPSDEVVAEVRSLVANGVCEIELLGQTINAYRCPVTGGDFADLLESVAAVDGVVRLRYITSHPRHFSDRLIDVLARNPHVSRYLHLPFQAGSDRVLKRMNRKYTRSEYLGLMAKIRTAVPDINLSTDVIVGFPGETEDDFLETLDLLQQVRFGQVYAFAYSPRPRTPAARYGDQIEEQEKKERLHRLFAISDTISAELNEALVGHTVDVLIDGASRKSDDDWQGRADDNRIVNFPKTGHELDGEIVPVTITRSHPHSLYGERARVVDDGVARRSIAVEEVAASSG